MFRVDAQHSFAPPHQGPEWYGKILGRNRFEGSVYVPHEGGVEEALALAARHPYIRRVVPEVTAAELDGLPSDPLIVSVRLQGGGGLAELARRGLALETEELPAGCPEGLRVVLTRPPASGPVPPNVFVKLTGFRLPATPEQAARLRELLRDPGPERLMYASGWPLAGATWKETLAAFTQSLGAMPIALREQLLGGTARAFYRI